MIRITIPTGHLRSYLPVVLIAATDNNRNTATTNNNNKQLTESVSQNIQPWPITAPYLDLNNQTGRDLRNSGY